MNDLRLLDAAADGNSNLIKKLLEKGVDVNSKNGHNETALMRAAWNNRYEATPLLLDAGADVNAQNNDGHTALLYAVEKGNGHVAHALVMAGADINVRDNEYRNGDTILMMAIRKEHLDCAKLLIAAGADVNAKNERGETAFTIADECDLREIKQKLVEAGADAIQLVDYKKVLGAKVQEQETVISNLTCLLDKSEKANGFLQTINNGQAELIDNLKKQIDCLLRPINEKHFASDIER